MINFLFKRIDHAYYYTQTLTLSCQVTLAIRTTIFSIDICRHVRDETILAIPTLLLKYQFHHVDDPNVTNDDHICVVHP